MANLALYKKLKTCYLPLLIHKLKNMEDIDKTEIAFYIFIPIFMLSGAALVLYHLLQMSKIYLKAVGV